MRRAARVDANQGEIVAALRATGAHVELLHMVGRGVPDLLVGYLGRTHLLECKAARGRLTPEQTVWHANWRGAAVEIVRSPEDALAVIGAV